MEPDPSYEGVGYSAAALGELFRVSQMTQFDGLFGLSLADHISTVLTHTDTPPRIYNALSEAVSELASKDEVQNRPEVVRAALAVHKAEEKGEGE